MLRTFPLGHHAFPVVFPRLGALLAFCQPMFLSFFCDVEPVLFARDVSASCCFARLLIAFYILSLVHTLRLQVPSACVFTVAVILLVLVFDAAFGICQAAYTFLFDRHLLLHDQTVIDQ
jgi:hypothetical protein